ncbi:glycosyltransferase [Nakamurella lactea]|uniref:glycosyltransferase n=1 Tax=Nakamurella lactea TaxID=459515 RepID=UPI000414F7B9|nr:glycosyltransferase [Nakamurella lactea]
MTRATEISAAESARFALAQRLRSAADLLFDAGQPGRVEDPADDAATVLDALIRQLGDQPAADQVWLVLTALAAAYPTRDEVAQARRILKLETTDQAAIELLDLGLALAQDHGEPLSEMEVLTHGVLVDVDHSAKHDLHTGIQRVVRNLLPEWDQRHQVTLAVWTESGGALRLLDDRETSRVLDWSSSTAARPDHQGAPVSPRDGDVVTQPIRTRIVVPWHSVVALVEVPPSGVSDRLASVGAWSGSRLVAIGYDAIPIVSADLVPPADAGKFVRYLTALKFSSRIAGISAAAATEMQGFVEMLPTQGLVGPQVFSVMLPDPPAAIADTVIAAVGTPLVLVVGSHEPRKNHLAVLHCAERLWRDGLNFRLRFIGGSGWGRDFPRRAADLVAAGRPVEVLKAASDEILERSYREASFSVFPSIHEGYGLPVVESLSFGTPVITTRYGSTAEIAVGGGTLTIDPREDAELFTAMRTLLTEPERLAVLRSEIAGRGGRSWAEYAEELWSRLVEPELGAVRTEEDTHADQ